MLNSSECLCKTDNSIARFGQCKLLTNADAWSSVEGNIGPTGTEMWVTPSFWAEFIGVRAVDVLSAMQSVGWKGYSRRFERMLVY